MLRITVSKNASAAVEYFNKALSKEDYYSTQSEVKGTWHGKIAKDLNLDKTVSEQDFSSIAHNRKPGTEEKLTPRDSAKRRAGYDFTFNAPKSASVVYAITQDDAILQAHQDAVQKAMMEIEQNAQVQTGQGKDKHYETTGNLVYAAYDHFTTRPVKSQVEGAEKFVPDPHLHTHCFTMNTTWFDKEERYRAVEMGNIKKEAPYYEALYHAHFTDALQKAGYGIDRTAKGWEIQGISRETIDKFSNRTKEINQVAKEKGLTWAEDKAKLGAKTRFNKNSSVPEEQLETLWQNRLSMTEVYAIASAKGRGLVPDNQQPSITAQQAIDRSLDHFLERKSAISEKRVLGHAMKLGIGSLTDQQVKAEMPKRQDIVSAKINTVNYITTKDAIAEERKMVAFAREGKGTQQSLNTAYEIQNEILNEGQRAAITHTLNSNDQVIVVAGGAGVGKTSLMQEVRDGIEQSGKQLFAFAPSADASRGVLREKGFKDANTIAALLQNQELQQQLKDNVILLDEAGMIGNQTMNQVFDIAQQNNARVILSGDWKQHNAVQAGDALRILEERSGLEVARVKDIVRQRENEKYKAAIKDLAEGKTGEGFNKLDKTESIIEIEDAKERYEQMAGDYIQSLNEGRSSIVVSPTHAEGRDITEVIRAKLKAEGKVEQQDREFTTQRSLGYTEEEKRDHANYQSGMVVQFHQNTQGGFAAGSKYDVLGVNIESQIVLQRSGQEETMILNTETHKHFQVFRKEQTSLAQGDLLRITGNGKSTEDKQLSNGQVHQIAGFDESGNIQLSNGTILDKDYRNFTLGYYRTSHAAQGKDADDVLIAQSAASFGASNQKQFYVSASRGAKTCRVYTDDKEELKWAVEQSADRMSASEVQDLSRQQAMQFSKWEDIYERMSINLNYEFHEQAAYQQAFGQGPTAGSGSGAAQLEGPAKG